MLLAVAGGALIAGQSATAAHPFSPGDYFTSAQFGAAVLVGLIATPLAPIAKDLASSLAAAAGAVKSVRP